MPAYLDCLHLGITIICYGFYFKLLFSAFNAIAFVIGQRSGDGPLRADDELALRVLVCSNLVPVKVLFHYELWTARNIAMMMNTTTKKCEEDHGRVKHKLKNNCINARITNAYKSPRKSQQSRACWIINMRNQIVGQAFRKRKTNLRKINKALAVPLLFGHRNPINCQKLIKSEDDLFMVAVGYPTYVKYASLKGAGKRQAGSIIQ